MNIITEIMKKKEKEPARIEPPVPEDGIIEEAAQTEQRTEAGEYIIL